MTAVPPLALVLPRAVADALSHPLAERAGWALLHSAWEIAAVALLLAAVLRLLRHASPNARYLAGCLALSAMAALPAATLLLLPRGDARDLFVAVPESSPVPTGSTEHRLPASHLPVVTPGRVTTPAIAPERPTPTAATPPAADAADRLRPYLPWLTACWAAGVLLLSLRTLGSCLRLRRLRSSGTAMASDRFTAALELLAGRLCVARPVRLLESALVEVPTVFGWLRPVILLPASALTGLSGSQIEAILAHELAHVRRHDYLVNLAQNVTETLLFYHPAVWWASAMVRREREHCCDDLAAAACGDRTGYAGALLRLEELRPEAPRPYLGRIALAATGSDLPRRVRRLAGLPERDRLPAWWATGLIALAVVAAPLLALRAEPEPSTKSDLRPPRVTAKDGKISTEPTTQTPSEATPPGESVRTPASPAGDKITVEGTVRDGDEKPIAGALVRLFRTMSGADGKEVARLDTADDGRFRFADLPAAEEEPGSTAYVAVVTKPGLSSAVRHVHIAGGPRDLDIRLLTPALLRGRVLDERHNGIEGAIVHRFGFGKEPIPGVWTAASGENGYYEITDLPPWRADEGGGVEEGLGFPSGGKHSRMIFHVRKPGYAKAMVSYGELPATIDVTLGPATIIEGRVLDGVTGEPVGGAEVYAEGVVLHKEGGSRTEVGNSDSATTDENGRYRLDALSGGTYNLRAKLPGRAVTAIAVFPAAARETTKAPDLVLTEGGFVTGRVLDVETGEPAKPYPNGFRVRVAANGLGVLSGTVLDSVPVQDDGTYRLRVTPGRASIYVQLEQDIRDRSIRSHGSADVVEGKAAELPDFVIRLPKPTKEPAAGAAAKGPGPPSTPADSGPSPAVTDRPASATVASSNSDDAASLPVDPSLGGAASGSYPR